MNSFEIVASSTESTVVAEYTPEKRKSTDYQSEAALELRRQQQDNDLKVLQGAEVESAAAALKAEAVLSAARQSADRESVAHARSVPLLAEPARRPDGRRRGVAALPL